LGFGFWDSGFGIFKLPIPYRRELAAFLEEFAEQHRGVRLGRMFGLPAIYVGRRLVASLIEDGVIVRLSAELAKRELKAGGRRFSRHGSRPSRSWVLYQPETAVAARRLTPILEIAAREMAYLQTEELTGVKLPASRSVSARSRARRARGR
jgi:TfoX/Sxy family transcriptional regulator of competence genes